MGDHARPRRTSAAQGLALAALLAMPAALAAATPPPGAGTTGVAPAPVDAPGVRRSQLADFQQQPASADVRHIAHWALDSGDTGGMPYIIIDKVNALVFVFEADGRLRDAAPALLGMGVGDVAPEGIGELRLAAIRPRDRTTPAGRFVASLDRDLKGQEILWIDYDDALALHRVVKGQPSERRAERLLSATPTDNRISYGCINVPVRFYEDVVSPVFRGTGGVVYILPETGRARDLFGSYEVIERTSAGHPVPGV